MPPDRRDGSLPVAEAGAVDGAADATERDDARLESDAAAGAEPAAIDGGTVSDAASGADAGGASAFSRYPAAAWQSPLTPSVVQRLRALRDGAPGLQDDVFMKAGDSATVSTHFMTCLAGAPYTVDLDGRQELQATLDAFAGGDADGSSPYQRTSLAAAVGETASWAISGAPSPLQQELTALQPRFALVSFGTNDMNMGVTHASALYGYYTALWALTAQLVDHGTIPVVTGLNPRTDTVEAARWVPSYNAVTRGLAEAFQVPFYDLYASVVNLAGSGMSSDGVHGNVYAPAGAQPCVFTAAGLAYNYNVRNLQNLTALDRLRRSVVAGDPAPEGASAGYAGQGTTADPFVVDGLPFTHVADTRLATQQDLDTYPGCGAAQDESGPEVVYRLALSASTPVRLLVLDLSDVDIDLHLLGDSVDGAGCIERNDKVVDRTLAPGTHHVVLDSYVPAGSTPRAGTYLFVALRCEDGDPDCQ